MMPKTLLWVLPVSCRDGVRVGRKLKWMAEDERAEWIPANPAGGHRRGRGTEIDSTKWNGKWWRWEGGGAVCMSE